MERNPTVTTVLTNVECAVCVSLEDELVFHSFKTGVRENLPDTKLR